MKVNLGDIILIPLSNGWKAVVKIVFIPVGDFKKGWCIKKYAAIKRIHC